MSIKSWEVGPPIKRAANGTFTIMPDDFFDLSKPIRGLPSLAVAKQIADALWAAESAGADHYAASED